MIPRIIIVPSEDENNIYNINERYIKAVSKNGGIPIISAYLGKKYIDEITDIADGIIFSGGNDPNPIFFKENPKYSKNSTPKRDIFEVMLCKKAFEKNIPILGICRGIQIICLAFGGTIYQDIFHRKEYTFNHFQSFSGKYPFHGININKNSNLYKILGKKRIYVNSFHHQGIHTIPKGFKISALSDDIIIEAIEYSGKKFIMGVQWHPEQTFENSIQRNIFKNFIYIAKGVK